MPKSPSVTNSAGGSTSPGKSARVNGQGAAAAELAMKAHAFASDPDILAEMDKGDEMIREISATVNVTEAPEDAVCSLVTDLLHYCEREEIDWSQEVMSRARERFRFERGYEFRKR